MFEPALFATSAIRSWAGYDIYPVPAPASLSLASHSGTELGIGNYYYFVTFTTALGESNQYPVGGLVNITTTSGQQQVTVTIPTSSDSRVTGRKLYRTKVGGGYQATYLLTTISDNTTTSFLDNIADSSLSTAGIASGRINSTTNYITVGGTTASVLDPYLTTFGIATGIPTGSQNTLFGGQSGAVMSTGGQNTAIGYEALIGVTTTSGSTAVGYSAGGGNYAGMTVIGSGAGVYGASYMTGVGYQSLYTTTGAGNSALGYQSGFSVSTGTYNTFLGYNAGDNASQLVTATNSTALGNGAYTTASNQIVLGNSSVTQYQLAGGSFIVPSSDSTTALTFTKADGTTPLMYLDTTDMVVQAGAASN